MKTHRRSFSNTLGTFKNYLLFFLLVVVTLSSCAHVPDCDNPQDTTCTRVLFIGNSYTYSNDLPTKFAKLAKSGNHAVEVGVDAKGGWTLADHVKAIATSDTLSSKRWTYVVLQEQSQIPAVQQSRIHSMYPAARILVKQVRNIGAKPLFFITWAHQHGAPENGMRDYESMQAQIDEGYYALSQELNVPVVAVGSAWQEVVNEHPEIPLWEDDGSHPSRSGTYLAACVFYAAIFQESPVGLTYQAGLPTAVANTLQTVASQIVLKTP